MNTVLPREFIERLPRIVPRDRLQEVVSSFEKERPTTFRVNTIKSNHKSLVLSLEELGFSLEPIPWYPDAFILRNKSKRELMNTVFYANGEIYIQSLSSMVPALVLDPKSGEKVCDMTAAPGSKTTQMAAMMGNTGEITANDRSRVRMFKLGANVQTLGVTNVTTTLFDGESFWKTYPEYFERTLLDAPCSLEGRFTLSDSDSYNEWSLKKVKDLSRLQRWLLRSAVSATKPGGVVVYSTCTLSPEENEVVVDWILEKEKGALEVEEIAVEFPGTVRGLAAWEGKTFDPRTQKSLRILPSDIMEGFFVVKIRKKRSTINGA